MTTGIRKTLIVVAGLTFGATAWAGGKGNEAYYDYAPVVRVKPITEIVQVSHPKEVCWTEYETRRHRRGHGSATPEIIGGIVGGLIGNQIGSGRGQTAATVAGAVLGGSIAHDVKVRRRHYDDYSRPVERCEVRTQYHQEEQIVGYGVKYRYHGRIYRTRMAHHPGDTVKVRVHVTAVE